MKSSNIKGFVSRYAMVQFFLQQLFRENFIDTDTYVFALNMAKEELGQKNEPNKDIYAYSLCNLKDIYAHYLYSVWHVSQAALTI